MGGKTVTTKTELPPETPEQREATATFNALLEAQMSRDYTKVENRTFVYNRQAEIDEIEKQKQAPGANVDQLNQMQNKLREEGGEEKISIDFQMRPEVQARMDRDQKMVEEINAQFHEVTKKVLNGDFALSSKQKSQIKSLTDEFFDPIANILKTEYGLAYGETEANYDKIASALKGEFDSAESATQLAIDRLMATGKEDLAEQFKLQVDDQRKQAELLGRSFQDTKFQRDVGQFQSGALERLYKSGASTAADAIAGLRSNRAGTLANLYGQQGANLSGLLGQRAAALGGVAEQRGLAGYNLGVQAANPLATFGAGAQFAQLQGALGAQNLANAYMPINTLQDRMGQMNQMRGLQGTTTETKPFDIVGLIGALGSAAGAAASGI